MSVLVAGLAVMILFPLPSPEILLCDLTLRPIYPCRPLPSPRPLRVRVYLSPFDFYLSPSLDSRVLSDVLVVPPLVRCRPSAQLSVLTLISVCEFLLTPSTIISSRYRYVKLVGSNDYRLCARARATFSASYLMLAVMLCLTYVTYSTVGKFIKWFKWFYML